MDTHSTSAELDEIEDEEFKCCVCLELMYKPVVLACGHMYCFWCVRRTMNAILDSKCPICRYPYNHFPSVSKLLHLVIKTLYPAAFKKREMQTAEEEKKRGYYSPQFPEDLSISSQTAQLTHDRSPDSNTGSSVIQGDTSCTARSQRNLNSNEHGCSEVVLDDQRNPEAPCSGSIVVKKWPNQIPENLSSVDFLCPSCNHLLFRPVVLNCGHVHCQHCLRKQQNSNLKCQVCESPNPCGLPRVCLVLDNLIADRFRELHGQRRESVLKQENGGPSDSAMQTSQSATKTNDYAALWWTGRGPKVHIGVGCDYCGISPIIGERYKCLDCTEIIGFDLCETCYVRTSIFPGRFNQQHKLDHRFENKQPDIFNLGFIRPEVGESDDDDDDDDEYSSHDSLDDSMDGHSNTVAPDASPPS